MTERKTLPSMLAPEHRTSPRKALRRSAIVTVAGQPDRVLSTRDVGLDGLGLVSPQPIAPGTRASVSFELPLGESAFVVTVSVRTVSSSYAGPDGFRVGARITGASEHDVALLSRFIRG